MEPDYLPQSLPMLQPVQRGETLLLDLKRETAQDQLHIWRLGPSSFIICFQDAFLCLDLQLTSDPAGSTAGYPPVMAAEDLGMITCALSTRITSSHFHPRTVLALKRAAAGDLQLLVPCGMQDDAAAALEEDPPEIFAIDDGDCLTIGPFDITGVTTQPEASPGGARAMNYAISAGGFRIFYCSHQVCLADLSTALRRLEGFDIMLLPVEHEQDQGGTLSGCEAASVADIWCRGIVIPHHIDASCEFPAAPPGFEESCERLKQDYEILRCGERLSIEPAT